MSQECSDGPLLRHGPDRLTIEYDFETPDGSYSWAELSFPRTVAFLFTAAGHCTEDQVAAYDKLLEIADSPWLASISDPPAGTRHLRIYFDDAGCYEVLAGSFESREAIEPTV